MWILMIKKGSPISFPCDSRKETADALRQMSDTKRKSADQKWSEKEGQQFPSVIVLNCNTVNNKLLGKLFIKMNVQVIRNMWTSIKSPMWIKIK